MGRIEFTLEEVFDELNIKGNRVAALSGVRPNTVHDMKNNNVVNVGVDNLADIIDTLNAISKDRGFNKKYDLTDIMRYIDK
jgi:DNA-binding Xre family transcriptional regulator